eukprot:6199609-Pleurochrysis_carterae.AAC.8
MQLLLRLDLSCPCRLCFFTYLYVPPYFFSSVLLGTSRVPPLAFLLVESIAKSTGDSACSFLSNNSPPLKPHPSDACLNLPVLRFCLSLPSRHALQLPSRPRPTSEGHLAQPLLSACFRRGHAQKQAGADARRSGRGPGGHLGPATAMRVATVAPVTGENRQAQTTHQTHNCLGSLPTVIITC